MAHPRPLTLPADISAEAARTAIAGHFGPGGTVLGFLTPHARHAGIHRAELTQPHLPHCGMVSHGELAQLTQVVAVTDRPSASEVAGLLHAAGVAPCRMCRRCWRYAPPPTHEPQRRCFEPATGTPPRRNAMSRITLDTTDLRGSLDKLDPALRSELRAVLGEIADAEYDALILAAIRAALAENYPAPADSTEPDLADTVIGLVFGTGTPYDDGYYLGGHEVTVLHGDGSTDDLDLGDDVDELLTARYGKCGPDFTLAVDLRTGHMDADDDDRHPRALYRRFGFHPPQATR